MMKSNELVRKTIIGENDTGVTPVYGWVGANLSDVISQQFGSVRAFEDAYQFDMAHIFGGPNPFDTPEIHKLQDAGEEITPEMLLDLPMKDPNLSDDYLNVRKELEHQKISRERFCYMQSNGIFEALNGAFGIENHLCYMAMYPDELGEIYHRQTEWNLQFISNIIDIGIDMIHISDDWGAQSNLLFNPKAWRSMILPRHIEMVRAIHDRGVLASLHSDGNINSVLDGIVEIGYDLIHPYQESAGMDYGVYLEKYKDSFALLGGLCVQSTIGFGDLARLESEIRRVFSLLKNQRWVFCTTHFIQAHCSIEELIFAYDLVMKLRQT